MLAIRIIPQLLSAGGRLVKGRQFNAWRSVGVAVQAARIHAERGVDELLILDITATKEGRGPDLRAIEQLTETAFMPISAGGGVRTLEHVRDVLRAGADKVVIGTWAPALVLQAAKYFGSQAIVASVDVVGGKVAWEAGRAVSTLLPADYAKKMEDEGAGELLLQSIDREGTMQGYDLELVGLVSRSVNIPVIAAGGCSGYQDMVDAVRAGASAVSAGALFQFDDATPRGAAQYMAKHAIEVRL